jgi:DNA-binding FrmR family transcriptional regulator
VRGIARMVDEDRYCIDGLTQVADHRALRPRPRRLDRHGVHFLTAYLAGV